MMISIIIPVYKVEKFLNRCVNSVLSQSYKNYEVILVDDGSPDNCPKMCDELAVQYSCIKVVHKKNGGLSSARNAGIEICKGDYIFFMDSDDWLSHDKVLENFILTAENNNSDFVYGKINSATDDTVRKQRSIEKYKSDDLFLLSNPYYFSAWNKLYGKNLLPYIHFTEGRINEDVDIIPLVFCKAKNVSLLNDYTYNYYVNPQSITRVDFSEKKFDMFKSVKHVFDEFSGTEKQKQVFYENLFGFQLFSVYIDIIKKTSGNDRKKYLLLYLAKLRENGFKHFYTTSFKCFIHYESIKKIIKKTAALIYLLLFSIFEKE